MRVQHNSCLLEAYAGGGSQFRGTSRKYWKYSPPPNANLKKRAWVGLDREVWIGLGHDVGIGLDRMWFFRLAF